jgi:hypothetical protein
VLRRPIESAQYTSIDYTQELTDHVVLGSIGTVGDALDNALAESFVDSYKTELIADRVWRTRSQLELATVEWVGWFNTVRLHSSLGDIPPIEFETQHAAIAVHRSVTPIPPKGLTASRALTIGVDFDAPLPVVSVNDLELSARSAQAATTAVKGRNAAAGLSDLRVRDILTDKNIKINNTNDQEPT